MRTPSLLLLFVGACLCTCLWGCQTRVQRTQADTVALEAARSHACRAWEFVHEGRVAGVLVEFQENHGERRFFSVRNAAQQELGLVDEHGRAWRFVPHGEDPEWLGTGTVLEGARLVLGLESGAEAFEVGLELLAASDSDKVTE